MNKPKKNFHEQKHLTLSERTYIEQELFQGSSFKAIAEFLGKDPSTISKEIRLSARETADSSISVAFSLMILKHIYHLKRTPNFKILSKVLEIELLKRMLIYLKHRQLDL